MNATLDRRRRLLLLSTAAGLATTRLSLAAEPAVLPPPLRRIAMPAGDGLPSFNGALGWINSPPLDAAALRGKPVLVNFCTYTCINWLRTLPWVKAWAAKYQEQGLLTVGVHTPEFSFERDPVNVRPALSRLGIDYAVAIDSEHAIWRAFNNQYWPALYLADAQGRIRYRQFGEGDYAQTERMIQKVLGKGESALVRPEAQGISLPADWKQLRSPENYLGSARTENFASPGGKGSRRGYELPASLQLNQWALAGDWTMGEEASVSNRPRARLACRFHARDLHLVMSPSSSDKPLRFQIKLNGQPPGMHHGLDIDEQGMGSLHAPGLYQLIRQKQAIADQAFEIEFLEPGAQIYAFTFG